jgi:nitrate reductase NapE component
VTEKEEERRKKERRRRKIITKIVATLFVHPMCATRPAGAYKIVATMFACQLVCNATWEARGSALH